LRRFGLFHLQPKNKARLGNVSKRLCDLRKDSVTQKTSKAKPRTPAMSKPVKAKTGPTAMQKKLKQNLPT